MDLTLHLTRRLLKFYICVYVPSFKVTWLSNVACKKKREHYRDYRL